MREIKVAFCSGSEDLWPEFIEHMKQIRPDLPLIVVSEFPIPGEDCLPWHIARSLQHNIDKLSWHFRHSRIVLCALILQPRMPYWPMRRAALHFGRLNTLFFNENLNHFMLRPRSLPVIARHLLWRTKNFLRWELRPGGSTYTFLWRLAHPSAFRRPLLHRRALRLGRQIAAHRTPQPTPQTAPPNTPPLAPSSLPEGITVVIPSRDGRDLLARLFETLLPQLASFPHQVIVVDNGSSDGTRDWLASSHPAITVEHSDSPLSFAVAVNRGIRLARYSRLLLLNNDMTLEPGFFPPLLDAFHRVPDLFCATAQILFPEGIRREETGKAVWCAHRKPDDFFLRCDTPLLGEDHTYVLYGSGGCSLMDTSKLHALGALGEQYVPAYVEDLDLGYRAWQRNWPTVFVAAACVIHRHRATTTRFYTPRELDRAVQINFLRWLSSTIASPALLNRLWQAAIERLNHMAARMSPDLASLDALEWAAAQSPPSTQPTCSADESLILALGSGEHALFPAQPATNRPRIVVVSPYAPFPLSHGGAVRMFNLMREAARDFDQILIYFAPELAPPPPELAALCTEIAVVRHEGSHAHPLTSRPDVVEEFDSPTLRALLPPLIRKWNPAAIQLEFTQLAQYASSCGSAPTIMVEHDVTLDLYAQLLRDKDDWETRQQYERWTTFERDAWTRVSRVVVMSDKDARTIAQPNSLVLANGVDLDRFTPSPDEPEPRRLLFIGSFAHLPNVMALDWFLREAWPLLSGYTLHIIAGKQPEFFLERYRDRVHPPLQQPGIELEAFVSDPRPAYRRASVVIAPLLASAGTNIKIMEAMAMGKAVVSTPGGVNGLDDLHPFVSIAESGAQFAAAITALEDPTLRRQREHAAREQVAALYGWQAIGEKQKQLYQSLMPKQA
ncbi:MAG: glycosyltransferase [Bryobacterales bacterium]|nr:glycosyltransferase [Bryobacterales bacterium]